MSDWNFADVWETVAQCLPDALAQACGDRRYTWSDFNGRADGVARTLLDLGLGHQDKVAQYLGNSPAYLESVFGVFKAGMVPVNTNYRYTQDELYYLWDNSDTAAVVFEQRFVDTVEALRPRLGRVRGWLCVEDGTRPCPTWAIPFSAVTSGGVERSGPVRGPWGRSGDDLYMLYTGGTTGMPKGVMWRQDDLFASLNSTAALRYPEDGDLTDVRAMLSKPGPVNLPACPLMHGTGAFAAFGALGAGGSVVSLEGRSFRADAMLDAIDTHGVKSVAIVGEAFAKPMLEALDADPDRWDISSLRVITSSGVMWSQANKDGLLRHNPRLLLVDTYGSSEAIGMASSVTSTQRSGPTARFAPGSRTRVLTEDGLDVVPGSGQVGVVAMAGRAPLGYYKDPDKSQSTFKVIDGVRYAIPGDFATVEADGSLQLLGRGSVCINTGGEKVFPEEVEEALKLHPSVADAAAVGLPDERFGQIICAVVEPGSLGPVPDQDLIGHVRSHLASYKAPRRVIWVASLGRAANGKLDYAGLKDQALALTGAVTGR
ncbi:MAG: AMP-binding protein [Acidimicrobiales bacterium]